MYLSYLRVCQPCLSVVISNHHGYQQNNSAVTKVSILQRDHTEIRTTFQFVHYIKHQSKPPARFASKPIPDSAFCTALLSSPFQHHRSQPSLSPRLRLKYCIKNGLLVVEKLKFSTIEIKLLNVFFYKEYCYTTKTQV